MARGWVNIQQIFIFGFSLNYYTIVSIYPDFHMSICQHEQLLQVL